MVSTFAIIASSYMVFIAIVTILGNGLVISSWIICKEIRSPGNLYLVSLAVVDFLTGLCEIPLLIGYGIADSWPFGPAFCIIYIFDGWLLISVSIFHLIAIAVDRYQLVYDGPSYIQRRSIRSVLLRIGLIWTLSFMQIVPAIFEYDLILQILKERGKCASIPSKLRRFHLAVLIYFVPVVIICTVYRGVYKEIQRRIVKKVQPAWLNEDKSTCSANLSHGSITGSNSDAEISNNMLRPKSLNREKISAALQKQGNVAKTLGIVILCFVVSWAPYFVMYPIIGLLPESLKPPPETFVFVLTIGFSNSAMNPIIYTFYNLEFRAAFKKVLSRK